MNAAVSQKMALLIDADNQGPAALEQVFVELQKHAVQLSVLRAYGGLEKLTGISAVLRRHAVRAFVNQGKGTTDVALTIDAMDLLHDGQLPNIVGVVSSDADFAPLVIRLRESGALVWCFASRSNATAESLYRAYDKVFFVDDALNATRVQPGTAANALSMPTSAPTPSNLTAVATLLPIEDVDMVRQILDALPDWLPNTVKMLNQIGGPLRSSGIAKGSKPLHELFRKFPAYFKVQPPSGPAKQVKLLKKPD